jgi:ABC-type amino acid transport substrate-binding protein
MTKRLIRAVFGLLCVITMLVSGGVQAQQPPPLSTLVPPTLFPTSPPPTAIPALAQSSLARIRKDKDNPRLMIGILYNAEPFASLNNNGEVVGFEADIARAFAQDWGIPLAGENVPSIFKQVTRQNGLALLERGEIDMLMGKVIHTRELEKRFDFSEPYFVNYQVALALGSAPENSISELGGKTVGVVYGSATEQALEQWQKASGVQVNIKRVYMFDDGIRALVAGEIAVLAGDRWELDARVRGDGLQGLKLLQGSFRSEPYAVAFRSHDYALRMLANRTLQRYVKSERLGQIYDQWFPRSILPPEQRTLPQVWNDLDKDQRTINDFPVDITVPGTATAERVQTSKTLRVAGLGSPDASGKYSAIDAFSKAMVEEMAKRWGVTAQFVGGESEEALASGAADIAIGLEPHWGNNDLPDRVDFTAVYAERSYRLLVVTARKITGFASLQIGNGKNLGIFADDEASFPIAEEIGKSAGVIGFRKILIRDENEIGQYAADGTMSAVFGDSLRLVPLSQRLSGFMTLLPQEYFSKPIAFAVQRGDSEFRAMVEQMMQEMAQDGTYQRLWKEQFGIGDPLNVLVRPES